MTESLQMSVTGIFITTAISILVAEFAGYGLHRLLHSGLVPALSRGHMIHHLCLYGPKQPMRAAEYKDATEGRASIGNIGLEWLIPCALILSLCWAVMRMLGVSHPYQWLALSILLTWPIFMFSYLHDRMHLEGFWMERTPVLKSWFRRARRLHDIHHRSLNERGRMDRNFGIAFFFFDRVFLTFARRHCPFNWHGYRAAVEHYKLEQKNQEDIPPFPSQFRL